MMARAAVKDGRVKRLLAATALLGAGALAAACSTKIGGPAAATLEGRPCAVDTDCPQPQNKCQVWTCWQEVCTPVNAAAKTLLPPEQQKAGDCKILVCDGQGQAVGLEDRTDEPPEDDNPCAVETCQDGEPAYPPVDVGEACGKGGVCNGHGKCGSCLPSAQRCQGNTPETCSEEGAWESEGACPAESPICAGKACIGITFVAAGDGFTCGRLGDGTARCFGDPLNGKLGNEGARRVGGLFGSRQVAAGARHTCSLMADATVKCWGSNLFDQLGDGTPEARGVPAAVPKLDKVMQISAGLNFTCAQRDDKTAVCWGDNEFGQLGTAPVARKSQAMMAMMGRQISAQDRPSPVVGLTNVVRLALGQDHGCALLGDSGVSCWGLDADGVLGRGSPPLPAKGVKPKAVKTLVPVKGLKDVLEVAAGGEHACARLQDGTVSCWGRNHHGQLGDGTTKQARAPVAVKGLKGAVALSLGLAHSCALIEDGSVSCWGAGGAGQLGDETKADHAEPFAVPALVGVAEMVAGAEHVCVRMESGLVQCWGGNSHGELGSGSSGEKPSDVVW